MAKRLGLTFHPKQPLLAGCVQASSSQFVPAISVSGSSNILRKWSGGGRAPRRLVLGLGASFWAQYMNMAGTVGGKSFIASARLSDGPSVEEILKNVDWPEQFPFKKEDFQRYDE